MEDGRTTPAIYCRREKKLNLQRGRHPPSASPTAKEKKTNFSKLREGEEKTRPSSLASGVFIWLDPNAEGKREWRQQSHTLHRHEKEGGPQLPSHQQLRSSHDRRGGEDVGLHTEFGLALDCPSTRNNTTRREKGTDNASLKKGGEEDRPFNPKKIRASSIPSLLQGKSHLRKRRRGGYLL